MRALAASLAALAAVAGLRFAASPGQEGIPLITFPQGLVVRSIGEHRVFVLREGSLQLTGWLARAPVGGDAVWYCPISQVFLEPRTATMWDATGRYVIGTEERDLTRVPLEVDNEELLVTAGEPQPSEGRSDGTVAGEVKLIYDNWLAGRIPLEVEFCRNALK